MIIGHLAVSALEHRYVKAALVPVMASAVFPDLVDKIAHYGFGQHASGRMWGHTLLGALITSAAVFILFGRHNAASWALGYLSHLVCDIGGVVPWLAPFVTYEFPPAMDFMTTLWVGLTKPLLLAETTLCVWAIIVHKSEISQVAKRYLRGTSRCTPQQHAEQQGEDLEARGQQVLHGR